MLAMEGAMAVEEAIEGGSDRAGAMLTSPRIFPASFKAFSNKAKPGVPGQMREETPHGEERASWRAFSNHEKLGTILRDRRGKTRAPRDDVKHVRGPCRQNCFS